jgi:hypothetical protein
MYQIPGVAEELHKVGLDEPVPTNHPQGCPPPLSGKLNSAIRDVLQ